MSFNRFASRVDYFSQELLFNYSRLTNLLAHIIGFICRLYYKISIESQSLLMAGGEPNVPTEPDQLTKQIRIQVAAPIGSKITLNSLSSASCCQNVAPDVSVPQKGLIKNISKVKSPSPAFRDENNKQTSNRRMMISFSSKTLHTCGGGDIENETGASDPAVPK